MMRIRFTVALMTLAWAAGPHLVRSEDSPPTGIYDRQNLVAWCIVPFDGKKRGPAARAEMLKRVGLQRVAYDWREEHVPTFEQEILEYKKRGLEYFAFWGTHPEAWRLFKKYDLHPQIWSMMSVPASTAPSDRVAVAAKSLLPLVEQTRELKSKLGLYNHGGWAGEPENLVAVCKYLQENHDADHVGIVYNQHHAHNHIDDFAKMIALMKPYLLCLNLNGMTSEGDKRGQKILPLGEGEWDVPLLKVIRDSGYQGPIGIIGHTQDDVELRLRDNLDGLDWIVPQLSGKPAGPKARLRTWDNAPKKTTPQTSGTLLEGKAAYRQPPITVECRATLTDRSGYNILVASDTKASAAHWELFSMNGSGQFTAYLPGLEPDHVRSTAMICDGRPHTVGMIYEAERVRLFVDGKQVADQRVKNQQRRAVDGGLGIGRLVSGDIGYRGSIEWVRISRGARAEITQETKPAPRDAATLLLWKSKPPAESTSATAPQRVWPQEHSPQLVSRLVQEAVASGDPRRGLAVFTSAKLACLSCHRLGEYGGQVGPSLAKLGAERKPPEIVASVLWPNLHVKPEYAARLFLTDDGRSHRGYVLERNDQQVTLRDPTQPETPRVIAVESIEAEQDVGTLMPDNLVATLDTQKVNDLFSFLIGLGTEGSVPQGELDALLAHANAHLQGPAKFPYERKPLEPADWPGWEEAVNRDRVYDFYRKEAQHFRDRAPQATLLAEFPGLDGGTLGHWGNQNDDVWASDRWNETRLDVVQAGIFRGAGVTVPRGVCVQLEGGGATCFNPDTLTYDALWKDGFLKFSSFRHGFLNGVQLEGTALPRPAGEKSAESFSYRGFYRRGPDVIFAYEKNGQHYLDHPVWQDGQLHQRIQSSAKAITPPHTTHEKPLSFAAPIRHGTGSPYAVDTFELPTENPWKAQLFVGGIDFLPDGSALVCTMQGDVWRVTNIAYPSQQATWQRFASGLHHCLGLVIDDDGIFVLGRDQITRLHDENEDGVADFYECFSKAYVTSPAGHDFICGLERDEAGYFYLASGNQGIVKISPDGKRAEVVATGFRNPDGLGLLPDGTVTVPCSEGTWTPASMICAARPGASPSFHGMGGPRDSVPLQLPLVYLPRGLDNSAGGQTLVSSDRWGPLRGQLLHFSFGTGSHMLVLRDEVAGQLQGAVVPLPGEFRSGAHRGRFNSHDGQLYVGGMQGWGSYTPDEGCFQRVRYTGKPVQLPSRWRAHQNGVAIEFTTPLNREIAANPRNHFAQSWNYRYSAAYGSPEYSARHYGMRGHDRVQITRAVVSEDRKTLFLEMPDLQPVNQLHLLIKTDSGNEQELFATVHALAKPYTEYKDYRALAKQIMPHPIQADLALAQRSAVNPHQQKLDGARAIRIETGTNLSYKTRTFRAQAGEAIALTLVNPDVVPHNWALVKPGSLARVGGLANKFITDPEAAIRQYIPDTTDVLVYTDVVFPKDEFTIYFRVPQQPGRYPYLCTFPGHWLIMNGEMVVDP